MPKPEFDPSKPFVAAEKPAFDPNKEFKAVDENPVPTMSPADAVVSKLSQGLTGGYADEILGGLEAAGLKAGEKVGLVDDQKPFIERYREQRDIHRRRSAQASHDYPILGGAADLAGNAAALMSPVGAAARAVKGAGYLANGAKILGTGAAMGAGGSNTDLTQGPGQAAELAKDAGIGAGVNLAGHALLSPIGYVAGKFAPGVLAEGAEQRVVKATIGQNKGAFNKMQQQGTLQKTGRDLLNATDAEGNPVVGYFSNAEDILPKVSAQKEAAGKAIGDIGQTIDDLVAKPASFNNTTQTMSRSPQAVSGFEIAKKMEAELAALPATPKNSSVRGALQNEIDYYKNRGMMGFEEAQRHKGQYVFKPTDSTTQTLGQDVTNKARGAVSSEMDNAAEQLAANPNTTPDIKDKLGLYKSLKSKYGSFADAEKYGEKKVMGDLSNRVVSPSDYAAGATTGVMAAAAGNPLPAVQGAVGGIVNKQLRERGSAFAARTMDKLSQILAEDPAGLNRFRGVIEKSAANGPQSLMLTHKLLSQDPSYQEVIDNYNARDKK